MWRSLVVSCCVLMCWGSGIQAAVIQCTRPNEHYACGSACQTTCANLGTTCPIVNIRCNDACYCNDGYARNANGTCIPIAQCPINSRTTISSRAGTQNSVTTTQRPLIQCTRPNEHYECGSACQTTCANLGTTCPIVNIRCNDACYCNDGYARDANGTCIPIAQCPINSRTTTASRSGTQNSVTTTQRPLIQCTRPNEHYECGSACQTTCANLGTTCPIVNIRCNDACYCNDGYARNANGTCIPISQCPSNSRTTAQSSFQTTQSRPQRNSETNKRTKHCKKSIRKRRGDKEPVPICHGQYEVYTDCYKDCPPNTCLSLVARFKCDGSEPCKQGCVCKPGYLRQEAGTPCIPIRDCKEMQNVLQS
ncbi:zonadhesin-like isoform X1 [Spodoptera frugiperda]|uniref:Zonadhesin-like isoform X1 n=1 Tax=Spodoptera frugiperda TaxID=7108 RepID=A0A9R0E161_SPOFR|nr:zonadhesin-like isoform X1 [Spodoptera frugiperda]